MVKKRIMVIDDEEDFTKMIKMRLESSGSYEVKVLPQVKDILVSVHAFKPDVILLDLLMPVIGGLEVCKMLNNDPIGINIPIIILSALDKDADKMMAYKLGIVDYLEKPIDSGRLISSIEKAIKSKSQ